MGWQESSRHSSWMLAVCHFCPTSMARPGNATAPASAPGASLQSPSKGLIQVRWSGDRVSNEVPSSQLSPWSPAASLVRDPQGQERGLRDRLDLEQQWGLSLPGLVSHHLGGHSLAPGVPPCQPFWSQAGLGGQGLSCSGTALLGAVRTVGARGPGLEAAGSALSQGREQGM